MNGYEWHDQPHNMNGMALHRHTVEGCLQLARPCEYLRCIALLSSLEDLYLRLGCSNRYCDNAKHRIFWYLCCRIAILDLAINDATVSRPCVDLCGWGYFVYELVSQASTTLFSQIFWNRTESKEITEVSIFCRRWDFRRCQWWYCWVLQQCGCFAARGVQTWNPRILSSLLTEKWPKWLHSERMRLQATASFDDLTDFTWHTVYVGKVGRTTAVLSAANLVGSQGEPRPECFWVLFLI